MAKLHLAICDRCGLKAEMESNGEHWLPPENWMELVEAKNQWIKGLLCPGCNPLMKSGTKVVKTKGSRKVDSL